MDKRIGLGTHEPHPLLRGAESLPWLDLQMRPQQRLSTPPVPGIQTRRIPDARDEAQTSIILRLPNDGWRPLDGSNTRPSEGP